MEEARQIRHNRTNRHSGLVRIVSAAALILAAAVLPFAASLASGPSTNMALNYQARITDSNGIPLADGAKNFKFVIYDTSDPRRRFRRKIVIGGEKKPAS